MEIFDEIYSNNFLAVTKILSMLSKSSLKGKDIQKILNEYNSTLMLSDLKALKLIDFIDGEYISGLECSCEIKRPFTDIEKAWLKAIISDEKIHLFLNDDELNDISELLKDVVPLFEKKDFRFFDKHTISDNYNDKNYILKFKNLIKAIHYRMFVYIELAESDTMPNSRRCIPYKLEYSCLDDAFRLIAFDSEYKNLMIFRLSEISKITLSSDLYNIPDENILEKFEEPQPVEIEVYNKRNAIERFMISFSNYHKETRFIKEKDCCITKIFFFKQDYESIIDNIVAFGPTVKILAPEFAVKDVVSKLKVQKNLFDAYQ